MPQLERKEIYYLIRAENIKKVEELPEEVQVDEFQYTVTKEERSNYDNSESSTLSILEGKLKLDKKYYVLRISQNLWGEYENFWRPSLFYGDELEFRFESIWEENFHKIDTILKLDVLEEVKSNKRKEI
jgi:hypothetical protein